MSVNLYDGELLIGEHNADTLEVLGAVHPDGTPRARGLVPRDYSTHPLGHYRNVQPYYKVDMPLIPREEWLERITELEAKQARLSDLRNSGNKGGMIPSLDQNGKGYCWAHSGTSAHLMLRARDGEPYVPLSAYAIACIIKSYRDEGGWGAQGLDFQTERGVPSAEFWPMQSMSRANDNAKTWENAALHKVTGGWVDLQAAQYDRNLTWDQVITCLLTCTPVIVDYNWWSHSVCAIDAVNGQGIMPRNAAGKRIPFGDEWEVTGGICVRILNSWSDSWSSNGTGVLTPQKSVPDGGAAPRTVRPSII